jgi:hypothetical protein
MEHYTNVWDTDACEGVELATNLYLSKLSRIKKARVRRRRPIFARACTRVQHHREFGAHPKSNRGEKILAA